MIFIFWLAQEIQVPDWLRSPLVLFLQMTIFFYRALPRRPPTPSRYLSFWEPRYSTATASATPPQLMNELLESCFELIFFLHTDPISTFDVIREKSFIYSRYDSVNSTHLLHAKELNESLFMTSDLRYERSEGNKYTSHEICSPFTPWLWKIFFITNFTFPSIYSGDKHY